jgi:hypothetical protein
MSKTPRTVWLFMQGYHASGLPPRVTWYTADRELQGRTDDYTIELYRKKGFVLSKRFLDPELWKGLEYQGVSVRHDHIEGQRRSTPCAFVIEVRGREGIDSRPTPLPARAVLRLLRRCSTWEGTASELLGLIGAGKQGLPSDPIRLSAALHRPEITSVLKAKGVTITRRRTASKRLIELRSS